MIPHWLRRILALTGLLLASAAAQGAGNPDNPLEIDGFVEEARSLERLHGVLVAVDGEPVLAEVVRGPASVLYGRASPGGVVALNSKRPEFEPDGELPNGVPNKGTMLTQLSSFLLP